MLSKKAQVAIKLRQKGFSLNEISSKLDCAKSSASVWVRGITISKDQEKRFRSNQEAGRVKAVNHPNSPKNVWARFREKLILDSRNEIPKTCSPFELTLVCAALYWGEGYKKTRNLFVFANTDPVMIKLMMLFIRKNCNIPLDRIRGRINIHPAQAIDVSEKYWSKISGIPRQQFHAPLLAIPKSSKGKRKTLPFGTFRIIISDVVLCSRVFGWIDGIKQWA